MHCVELIAARRDIVGEHDSTQVPALASRGLGVVTTWDGFWCRAFAQTPPRPSLPRGAAPPAPRPIDRYLDPLGARARPDLVLDAARHNAAEATGRRVLVHPQALNATASQGAATRRRRLVEARAWLAFMRSRGRPHLCRGRTSVRNPRR